MSKLSWYVNRLRAMSAAELAHRLVETLSTRVEKIALARQDQDRYHLLNGAYSRFIQEEDSKFYFAWDDRKKHQEYHSEHFPDEKQATIKAAGERLEHRFRIFQKTFELSEKIDWQQDPLTGRSWPLRFWADIDTRNGETVGGVKWVWELNRHHHLVTLAKAYFISGEERYATEVCAQIQDWIKTNPLRIGVNWTSPLELAIRIINWAWALAFIRRSPALKPEVFARVLHSIDQQARHIERHLSAFSSANNHLIGEAAGLAFIGMSFPRLSRAAHWRKKGMAVLTREVVRQIGTDGVPAEQAIHYLIFIMNFYLLIGVLAKLNGIDVPQAWRDRLSAACRYVSLMMDDGGHLPQIGDSDDAWVVHLDDRLEVEDVRSVLVSMDVFLGASPRSNAGGVWDERSLWLFGEVGYSDFQSLAVDESDLTSCILEQGGYAVLRTPGRVISFDFGPLGYLPTASHGHADALGLWIHLDGRPVLVDSGTYAYQEGMMWRNYFRSTRAHNTVVVDGKDQSQMRGTFLWGDRAQCQLHHWETSADYDFVIASHNGYSKQMVLHQRSVIFLKPDCLFVVDDLFGEGEHTVAQYWHFPYDAQLELANDCQLISSETFRIHFYRLDDLTVDIKWRYGEENPNQGWWSPFYGVKYRSPVLEYSLYSRLPIKLITAIYLSPEKGIDYFTNQKSRFYQMIAKVTSS